MLHDLQITQNAVGGVVLKIEGIDIAEKVAEATLEFKPSEVPTLTLKMPFMRCKYKGKASLLFKDAGPVDPVVTALIEENKDLKEMIDMLNDRIAILLDT